MKNQRIVSLFSTAVLLSVLFLARPAATAVEEGEKTAVSPTVIPLKAAAVVTVIRGEEGTIVATLDERSVTLAEMEETLRELVRKNPEATIHLRIAKKLKQEHVKDVLHHLKAAGVTHIALSWI